MNVSARLLVIVLGIGLLSGLAAGCGGTASPSPAGATPPGANASPSSPSLGTASPAPTSPDGTTPSPGQATPPAVSIDAAWAGVELTDVRTGERFRLADLAGRVIFIEPMAVWCSNCRVQQAEGAAMLQQLPGVEWIALDIDPSEPAELLADAAADRGHPFRWALAPADLSRGLEADFGTIVLNPVPTPLILIGSDGRITLTEFGIKSTATLVSLARDHGA